MSVCSNSRRGVIERRVGDFNGVGTLVNGTTERRLRVVVRSTSLCLPMVVSKAKCEFARASARVQSIGEGSGGTNSER